ncbi:MAG: hypothetical protein JXP34_16010 [Planctomycetes bacterium]|nr:hypothetical protein [Planctomycetota bacterium]
MVGTVIRSARVPLIGIAIVWASYAGFRIVRSAAREEPFGSAAPAEAPAASPFDEDAVERAREAPHPVGPPRPEDEASGADPDASAVPETEVAAKSPLRPEDDELLDVMSAPWEQLDDGLRAFLEEHPDHAVARALLALRLLQEDPRSAELDAEIRAHADLLRQLLPDKGLPDLLFADLEMDAGRIEAGRQYLFEAVEKDLSWLPDAELMRMRIERDLAAGRPAYKSLANAVNSVIPSCMEMRNLMRSFLYTEDEKGEEAPVPPPADPGPLDLHRRTARALLEVGRSLQDDGMVLIQNLVGAAIIGNACQALEQAGDLSLEEQALRERTKAIQAEGRLFSQLIEEILFTDPILMTGYLRDLAAYGERRAGRRAMMTYLGRDPAE